MVSKQLVKILSLGNRIQKSINKLVDASSGVRIFVLALVDVSGEKSVFNTHILYNVRMCKKFCMFFSFSLSLFRYHVRRCKERRRTDQAEKEAPSLFLHVGLSK